MQKRQRSTFFTPVMSDMAGYGTDFRHDTKTYEWKSVQEVIFTQYFHLCDTNENIFPRMNYWSSAPTDRRSKRDQRLKAKLRRLNELVKQRLWVVDLPLSLSLVFWRMIFSPLGNNKAGHTAIYSRTVGWKQ